MKVRELLSDESKWTIGTYARDAKGLSTEVNSDRAVRWCLVGAVIKCYPDLHQREDAAQAIYARLGAWKIVNWNDSHTFAEVKALIEDLDI